MTEAPDLDALIARAREARRLEREAFAAYQALPAHDDAGHRRWRLACAATYEAAFDAQVEIRRRIEGA